MSEDEIFAEATSVYDNYVEVVETGTFEALQAYARNLSKRVIPRGVETDEVAPNENKSVRRSSSLALTCSGGVLSAWWPVKRLEGLARA